METKTNGNTQTGREEMVLKLYKHDGIMPKTPRGDLKSRK